MQLNTRPNADICGVVFTLDPLTRYSQTSGCLVCIKTSGLFNRQTPEQRP